MEREEALDRLREVQRIMERTTLYTLLPGWPATAGGGLAVIGAAVSYAILRSWDLAALAALPTRTQAAFYAMWAVIAAAGVAMDVIFALTALGREDLPLPARPIRFAVGAISLSVFVALVFTVRIISDGRLEYLAPIWMMGYGMGVYSAGLFSVRLPRLLGLAFIATGALGLLALPGYGLLLTTISFGGFHIAFGVIVLLKSRRSVAR